MDKIEFHQTMKDVVARELEMLSVAQISELRGRTRDQLYQRVAEAVVGEKDVIPTLYFSRALKKADGHRAVGSDVHTINSILRNNHSSVLVCTIQEAVRLSFPEEMNAEINIGMMNKENDRGGLKVSSTLLYRQEAALMEKIQSMTEFPRIIRFTSDF